MSIVTNYVCDKCGNIAHDPNQFWTIGVTAKCQDRLYSNYVIAPMEVCRKCLESLGIFPSKETKAAPEYSPPTLEDLIIDIVERHVSKNT